jgi:hypothetical protein
MLKTIPLTPEIYEIARRVLWFEKPHQATSDTTRFLAYAMTYGDHAAMEAIRKVVTDDELREALSNAPPGIFDARSWTYWNLVLGTHPAPPLPERKV